MKMNKKLRDQYFKLNLDLTRSVKKMFTGVTTKSMEEVTSAYMSILAQESEDETIEVDKGTLQQMALLASVTTTRQLMERLK